MPVPAPDYELGQFFDLSPDLLCMPASTATSSG
jgi:hypothetical protein